MKLLSKLRSAKVKCLTYLRYKNYRRKLKNKDATIIASNCLGGIIYHILGLKFNSPFINLRISSNEFIKLVSNLREYLDMELRFIDRCEEGCPTAMLGDITVYFVHYKTEEEAEIKWNERKKRVNFDNLYILTNDCDGVTHEDMLALEKVKCKNACVFTSHKYPDCPHSLYFRQDEGSEHVRYTLSKSNFSGKYYFEDYFDFVGWLNSEDLSADNFWKGKV